MALSTQSGKCYEPVGACGVCVVLAPITDDTELLNGRFELHNTVYTLSILLSCSKNGIKSNSSVSVMSSNHDATGTFKKTFTELIFHNKYVIKICFSTPITE